MSNIFDRRRKELEKRFPVWERLTLGDRFDKLVEEFADREFIFTLNQSFSYREVQNKSNQLAKGLLKLGIKPREHVAVLMANYPEFIFLTFALAKIGAVKVPLNYRMRSEELAYAVKQSDSVCLIAMERNPEVTYSEIIPVLFPEILEGKTSLQFPRLRKIVAFSETGNREISGAIDFDELMTWGAEVPDAELEQVQARVKYPDEVVDILYTSGTTSDPKGVMLTHDMLWRSAYGSCLSRAFEDGRRIFVPIPFFHVFGYVEGILAGSIVGGAVIPQIKFNVPEAFQLIAKGKVNDILCVSAIAENLVNYPELKSHDLSELRAMYCAGTPVPLWTWKKIQQELNLTELNTGYGMTEVCAGSMQTAPGDPVEIISTRVGRQMPGGCSGLPEFGYKHTEYKVVDPLSGEDLPPGSEGELACRGNIVTKGYYNKPIETAQVVDKDGWLRTGDIGIIHSDGYFELTGRSKEMYKIGGENVSPKEIEQTIEQLPKVVRAVVVGVPDRKMGEVGVAFVEVKQGENCTCEDIIDHCSKKLAKFKVPKHVKILKEEEFPFNASGKIQKFKLQEMVIQEFGLKN